MSLYEQLESRLAATEKRLAEVERQMREHVHTFSHPIVNDPNRQWTFSQTNEAQISATDHHDIPKPQPEPSRSLLSSETVPHTVDPPGFDRRVYQSAMAEARRIKPDTPAASLPSMRPNHA